MADFYITEGDIGWELQGTIKDGAGNAVDVSADTNTFKMEKMSDSTVNISGAATDVDAVNGVIKYIGTSANAGVLTAGLYLAEFLNDPAGDAVRRVPTRQKIVVEVIAKGAPNA